MKKVYTNEEFNKILNDLSTEYDIYAPITKPFKGRFSDTDLVSYGKISRLEEMNLKDKSHYSPKEVLLPLSQVLFYFTEKAYTKPEGMTKKALVFLRSCDLHGVERLDNIYLNNKFSDVYYEEARNMVKFVIMGCPPDGWDSCLCLSLGTSQNENYNLGVRFEENEVYVDVKDEEFSKFFPTGKDTDFSIDFVKNNREHISIPESFDIKKVVEDEFWRQYDRCIACGRCNFVCPTCSCFTMQDIFYKDDPKNGERRRVWASCEVDGFTTMAGGHEFRKKTGDRMRYKVMHKIYDYNKRFGVQMCVGCGRCEDTCPEYISYIDCINKLFEKSGDVNE